MPSDGPPRGGTAIESQQNGESPGVSPSRNQPGGPTSGDQPAASTSGAATGANQPGGQPDHSGYAAIRSVLRIRPFRRLWIVLGAASFGDWFGLL
ncbi:hypothetical protein AB0I76_30470, partial [Micromonospora sp. NPDC049799]